MLTCQEVSKGESGGEGKKNNNNNKKTSWDGETGCICHAFNLDKYGASGSRCTENKYKLLKSSGQEQKKKKSLVFIFFVGLSNESIIDVRHVCTRRAAQSVDPVKAGSRILHPGLSFPLSVCNECESRQLWGWSTGHMNGEHCRPCAFIRLHYTIKTHQQVLQ